MDDVLGLHEEVITRTGGTPGILNLGAVDSALYRCQWGPFFGIPSMAERASFLMRGLCQDHPFADGNKRTSFLATDTFLRLNGSRMEVPPAQAVGFALDVAQDRLDLAAVGAWIEDRLRNIQQEGE